MTEPVRCQRDEWYLARARVADGAALQHATLLTGFLRGGDVIAERCLRLHALAGADHTAELLGWIQTPEHCTHLRLRVPDRKLTRQVEEIVFHKVAERDPKCHPLANVPRWSTYRPPLPIRRVVLPASLEGLARLVDWGAVEVVEAPGSAAALRRLVRGAACVLEPKWVLDLKLTLHDVERLAQSAWVLIDLETTACLVRQATAAATELKVHDSAHGLMSARVDYADVPTRGLALQDVVPYAAVDALGGFRMRVLNANRSWKCYADEAGFATLLSSETPWERHHGDVLSAARAVGGGELIATDLPWLVAGHFGPLVAPRIAAHLLRMHLAAPAEDYWQYWNRWDDGHVVVRDISDLARRYPPLKAVRWASCDPASVHLGLRLPPVTRAAARHVIVQTGRIDNVGVHDGLPPEPLMIFMKWLAREAREGTPWARRWLATQAVTWQFDSADGLKYAANYDPAPQTAGEKLEIVRIRNAASAAVNGRSKNGAAAETIVLAEDEGLFGDGSLLFQEALARRLRRVLERELAAEPATKADVPCKPVESAKESRNAEDRVQPRLDRDGHLSRLRADPTTPVTRSVM